MHISTALLLPFPEIQANPERADGSHRLLEILSASYIFHLNAALREPVRSIRKSNLCFSDACPFQLHLSLTESLFQGAGCSSCYLALAVKCLLEEPFSLP